MDVAINELRAARTSRQDSGQWAASYAAQIANTSRGGILLAMVVVAMFVVVGRKVALTTDQWGGGIIGYTWRPPPKFNQLPSLFVDQLILAI